MYALSLRVGRIVEEEAIIQESKHWGHINAKLADAKLNSKKYRRRLVRYAERSIVSLSVFDPICWPLMFSFSFCCRLADIETPRSAWCS